jgi:polysaccharide pyruvyl transferase WcaK-like protein
MKALFVGDHRDSLNWGGRGQSIALSQLLEKEFEISAVIDGMSVLSTEANQGWMSSLAPIKVFRFLKRMEGKSKWIDVYLKLEELLGAKDFVSEDPSGSLENFLRLRRKSSPLDEIYNLAKSADVILINGEGSGIFTTPARRDFSFYLMMAELGIYLKKKVFYVNGIISDCPFTGRNEKGFIGARRTLAKCTAVSVRDPVSLEYLQGEMPEVNSNHIPDALFTWFPVYEKFGASLPVNGDFIIPPPEQNEYLGKLDFSLPYVCLGGSSSAALQQTRAYESYLRLAKRLGELGFPVYLTQPCGGDRFLLQVAKDNKLGMVPAQTPVLMAGAVLANAALYVSGRFHATIFASLGGTPCIFLGAHSHKMASLMRTLEYRGTDIYSAFPEETEIDSMLTLAATYLREGTALRQRIKAVTAMRCQEAERLTEMIQEYL